MEGAAHAFLFLEDPNALFGKESLSAIIFFRGHTEGGVNVVLVVLVRIDRVFK